MKRSTTLAAAGLMSLGLANSAFAANFTPLGSGPSNPAVVFATGPMTIVQGSNPPITCTTKWKFQITQTGKGRVINATFNNCVGGGPVSPLNLNWTGKPASATSFAFIVTVMGPAGPCGGFQIFQLNSGVITFNNPFPSQSCTLSSTGLSTSAPPGPLGIVFP